MYRHTGKPAEFLPKGCRGLQGHLELRFQAPGDDGEHYDYDDNDSNDNYDDDNEYDDEDMDLILFGAHKEELVATLAPGCLHMCCLKTGTISIRFL